MINEGSISNCERQYRNFCGLVSAYKPNVEMDKIKVEKTQKGNWKVMDKDGNKICLVSRTTLSDELAYDKNLCERPVEPTVNDTDTNTGTEGNAGENTGN